MLAIMGNAPARTSDPDPVTGLTWKDKRVLQTSWAPVRKNLTGNGVALLLLLFDLYPQEKLHFPFKDVPKEELRIDKKFHAHCNNVMVSMDALIANLNDGELLVNLLERIARNHRRRGIQQTSFLHLKETILELFGTFMAEKALKTWDKLLGVAIGVIAKELSL